MRIATLLISLTWACSPAASRSEAPTEHPGPRATVSAAPAAPRLPGHSNAGRAAAGPKGGSKAKAGHAAAQDKSGHAAPSKAAAFRGAAGVLGAMLRDNELFAARHRREYFARFQKGQHPRVTVVACSDSRFHMHVLDRTPDDDIFVIRNIGNNVDATSGSVEYGLRHLHTPMLLIVGHVRCGAVKAAMGDYASLGAVVRRELDSLHLSIFRTGAHGTFAQRWLANVIGNVQQQVQYALTEYGDLVAAGTLFVVGAVYDFRDDLGRGKGRIHIVSLNGEKNGAKIQASRLVTAAKGVWKHLRDSASGQH